MYVRACVCVCMWVCECVYTLPIKSVTGGTHFITRHILPRWPCNSIGGRIVICEQHTTARYSLTWTPLPSRPNYCGHTRWLCALDFAGRSSCMCRLCTPLCVARCTLCCDKQGDRSTLYSQHACTIALISAEYVTPGRLQSGDTENGMSCALFFLATCREIQTRSTI
jgi:hypothetical protein